MSEDRVHLDGDGAPEPTEDMPELTAEDWAHSIKSSDRHRIGRGELRPGDVEKVRLFTRLSEDEMATACGVPREWLAYWDEPEEPGELERPSALRQLLRLAVRHPGAFRRLVK